MKIGTITVHNGRNYGASLQAFALVQFLRNNGFEASLIDYRTKKIEDRMNSYQTVRRGSSSAFKENLRMLTSNLLFDTKNHTARTEEKFTEFHQRFMEKDSGTFYFCEELSELTEKYDAFICGSDQIWNKNITDLDGAFFLEFAKKSNRKIAYAPSLGMPSENVDEETRKLLQKKLANLDFLSIREKNNRELIEQLTHRQCEVVADPVLLLEREEWDDVLDMSEDVCPKEPYAFYYPIVDQPELLEYAMKESKKRGWKLLNPRLVPKYAKMRGFTAVPQTETGPAEFLQLLKNAEAVFTNSFHATVFASLYKKELFVIPLQGKHVNRNNRILEYLRMIELYEEPEQGERKNIHLLPGDYGKTAQLLKKQREASAAYLKGALDTPVKC